MDRCVEQFFIQSDDFYRQLVGVSTTHAYSQLSSAANDTSQLLTLWKSIASTSSDEVVIPTHDSTPITVLHFLPISSCGVLVDTFTNKDTAQYLDTQGIRKELTKRLVPKLQQSYTLLIVNP
uniref:Uncharacterized protein n=1 Tax=Lygus hesperus TaxID=30085 RepID=A0A146KYY9_LYGHE